MLRAKRHFFAVMRNRPHTCCVVFRTDMVSHSQACREHTSTILFHQLKVATNTSRADAGQLRI